VALDPSVDDDRTAARSTRCPACGAGLRAGAPWCTQCWRDLRAPEPDPAPVAPPVAPPVPAAGPTATAAPSWPCPCGASNDLAHDACATCGAGLFDALRQDDGPALALPVLGEVAGLSKVQIRAAAVVLLVVLLAALLAAPALVGALLT